MTITNPDNIITFNGDGVTVHFPFPIYFLDDSHVVVTKIKIADQSRLALIEGLDYTLTGAGDQTGGAVTMTTAPTSAFLLEIKRIVPIIQSDNYHANDVFPAETFEKDLDYGIMVSQQLDRRIGAIESTGLGGGISLANLAGPGVGIYFGQVGTVHSFKKLVGAGGVTLVDAGTEIDITLAGALLVVNNLTDVANRQTALNNLTGAAAGGAEYVLTRDTATGNAVWKVAPTGSGGSGGALLIVNNLSDVASQQTSLNNVTAVAAATNEYVLTKDTATGNAKWKVSAAAGALLIANNLTDVANQQTALNNLTAVAPATNEYVLTKDTATGSAKWKAAVCGSLPGGGSSAQFLRGDSVWSNIITAKSLRVEYGGTPSELVLKNTAGSLDNKVWKIWADHGTKALTFSAFDDTETNAGTGVVITRNGINLTSIQLQASRTILANGSDDGVSALQVAGDVHILGTGRRIKGNFSDATPTNRLIIQTDQANTFTSVTVIPSGTGTGAFIQLMNNSDVTQPLAYGDIRISNTVMQFTSNTLNGGTQLPMVFTVGAVRARITPAGLFTIGEPTDDGVSQLQVNANAKAKTITFVAEIDDGTSGTAKTIDFTAGQYHKVSMTGACTFTFTPPVGPAVVQLKLTQDGTGSRVMTLPAGKWPGTYAAADKLLSTAINAIDLLTAKWDGTAWFYTLSKGWA